MVCSYIPSAAAVIAALISESSTAVYRSVVASIA